MVETYTVAKNGKSWQITKSGIGFIGGGYATRRAAILTARILAGRTGKVIINEHS